MILNITHFRTGIVSKKGFIAFFTSLLIFGWSNASSKNNMDTVWAPITPESFNVQSPLITPGTSAIVLYESTSASMDYDYGWSVIYTIKKRVKILSPSGFDLAQTVVQFTADYFDRKAKLKDFKASTYNLEDGKVVEIKIPKGDFLLENLDSRYSMEEKIAYPKVKVGSILEYSVTIRSYYIGKLKTWEFQRNIPILWSKMELTIPDFFNYTLLKTGNIPYHKVLKDSTIKPVWVGYEGSVEANLVRTQWIVKDVEPFKDESFLYCSDDYIGKLGFQIYGHPGIGAKIVYVYHKWQDVADRFLSSERFGGQFYRGNQWLLKPEMKNLWKDTSQSLDHAKSIFNFVQDQFLVSGKRFGAIQGLDDVYKNKQGNETEINLFMITLFRKAGFTADLVILSTRENGLLNPKFPNLDKINYCIVRLSLGDHFYFLDASNKQLGFGKIPLNCYNGFGIRTNDSYSIEELKPESITLSNLTSARIEAGKNNDLITKGQFYPDYYTSTVLRKFNKNDSVFSKSYLDEFKLQLSPFILDSISLKNKDLKEQPVKIEYQAHIPLDPEQLLYINPFLNSRLIKNPFIKEDRKYPVNLPGLTNDIYVLDLEIPKGYKIEELPKGEIYSMSPYLSFEYLLNPVEDHIQIRYKLSIQQTYFPPEEYDKLRLFYDEILKKANEFIVLKKI